MTPSATIDEIEMFDSAMYVSVLPILYNITNII